MNELEILLAKPIELEVGNHKYIFKHPNVKWWLEFISAIGGMLSASQTKATLAGLMSGVKDRKAEKILVLFCETIDTNPKNLLKDLTLHQLLALLDKWMDCIGIEQAQSFLKGLGAKITAALPGPKDTP